MVTNTKHTLNKSCSCRMCRRGRGSVWGQQVHRSTNRKLRHEGKAKLAEARKDGDLEVVLNPTGSTYTD
jgi:hypothetical protein